MRRYIWDFFPSVGLGRNDERDYLYFLDLGETGRDSDGSVASLGICANE